MPSRYSASSPKALRFVDEYLVDGCGAAAARRAGYSERRATQAGAELLKLPLIKKQIEAARAKRSERTEVNADRVLKELAVIAFSDIDHYQVDVTTGRVILAEGAPKSAKRALASVKYKMNFVAGTCTTELKFWDKNAAITNAMKHLGMLIEKHEVTLPPGTGVLAVPMPISAEQWGALAAMQQAALVARPATSGATDQPVGS